MRKSKTLARLRSGGTARFCVLGHYIPAYVAHAARAGFDCIWLDLEHRAQSVREIQAMLAYAHLYDIDIMIRAQTLDKTGLYRHLEDGAAGLMIPQVANAEMARKLVDATKFPPLGDRGIDNAGLDADFLLHDPDEYAAWANRETFLCVQIETPEAVRNIEEIVSVEGVDLVFIGPGDLGLRLRQTKEMTLDEAYEIVAAACRKHGKPFGGPALEESEMLKRHEQGARFHVVASEFAAFTSELAEKAKRFDRLD